MVDHYNLVLGLFLGRCWVFKFPFYKWRVEVATCKSIQIWSGASLDKLFIMCCLQFPLTAEQRTRRQWLLHVFQD